MTSGAAAGAGRVQAAQQVADLPGGLPRPGGGRGALGIDQRGPRGAQVPQRRDELVLPARDGLAGAVTAAGIVMDMTAARRALGIGAGIRGGVDREPQPRPPRARLPDLRGLRGRYRREGLFQQAVVDRVVLADPGQGLGAVDELRQRSGQQRGEGLVIGLPGGQRVIQRAVTAAELRHQRQLDQRGHRVIGTQDRVAQLEQRISPRGQAPVQPGTELPQRQVPVNRACHLRRIQGSRRHGRAAARRAAL
jgi:hypothetical protein